VEGQVSAPWLKLSILLFATRFLIPPAHAQEQKAAGPDAAELKLRKEVLMREFQGRQVGGEERQIGRGDSLWRILVEEKGLPQGRFRSYLVVIRGLNPQIKNLDVLRAGDKIFIPLRLGDVVKDEPDSRHDGAAKEARQPFSEKTFNYQVKPGEHLYQILRERYKNADQRKIAQYFALVKDLNPERKDWETLRGGEIIRLPVLESVFGSAKTDRSARESLSPTSIDAQRAATQPKPASAKADDFEAALRSSARENMDLLVKIVEATGNEVKLSGEEIVSLRGGNVRFDRSTYPVIINAALRQKVVIDRDGKIPQSLKAKLNDSSVGTPVLPIANGLSVAEAVRQLLAGIGYQQLPTDRPVVVQDAGIEFEAKGNWMALAPVVSNKTQEVLVINLTGQADEIPEYLSAALAKQGLYLREVVLPGSVNSTAGKRPLKPSNDFRAVRDWPRDKRELIDALLRSFRIPFGGAETVTVGLDAGLRVDTLVDRVLDIEGKRTGIFFRAVDPEIRRALQDSQGMRTIELDLDKLSSRELIARLLSLLGAPAAYSEHRFAAAQGAAPERLTLKAWGFNLEKKAMFVTDREIPPPLHRFFFEKGLQIVYFH
jgi:hypothetical protein